MGNCGRLLVPFFVGMMNDMGLQPIIGSSVFYFILGVLPVILVQSPDPISDETSLKCSILEE